jgi:hypothetical protein
LALPEWLPATWTREDGPVEWAGFACYLVAGLVAVETGWRRRWDRRAAVVALVFGVLLLVIAGEEVSWGQRIFDVETPAALVDSNRQDELNVHNIDGIQDKVVVGQLSLALLGALFPWVARRPEARAAVPFFLGYLAYRLMRGAATLLDWAPAGDNSEAAELLLAAGLLLLVWTTRVRNHDVDPGVARRKGFRRKGFRRREPPAAPSIASAP